MLRGPPGVATPGVSSFWGSIVNRTVFLIDGFNLYHSVLDAGRRAGRDFRWLDLSGLCSSYLHALPGRSVLAGVVHFSALPHHLEARHPGAVARQLDYLAALSATGVETKLGHFKARLRTCPFCGLRFRIFEEKETDVAIGSTLAAMACSGECDTIVLVTGDTDLVSAVRTARERAPEQRIGVLFPHGRFNVQLQGEADCSWTIGVGRYASYQLPDIVVASDGREIRRRSQ